MKKSTMLPPARGIGSNNMDLPRASGSQQSQAPAGKQVQAGAPSAEPGPSRAPEDRSTVVGGARLRRNRIASGL